MSNVITIDGPVSAGKNTIGYLFAQKIGYHFIDTGFIYRAGCIPLIDQNLDINNEKQNQKIFDELKIEFKAEGDSQVMYLDGVDITNRLHSPEVTSIVSVVAAQPSVREVAKKIQQSLGEQYNTVMSGRDIGSEIFPNAKLKFYLTASLEVRAKRRFADLEKRGLNFTYEDVYKDIEARDYQDTHRAASPLRVPEDAIVVDTTNLSIDQSVSALLNSYLSRQAS